MAQGRVGYALGYGKFTNVSEMAEVMQQAEDRGFEMAFFSETIELMRDSVSSLAAIGLGDEKAQVRNYSNRSLARSGSDGPVAGDIGRIDRRAHDHCPRSLH